jgi:2-amino-4-hydroxy-6-hydroxymethyldihydropteridine diphosphokinase
MKTIFIALGTNLGDRIANLRTALDALPPQVVETRRSHIYETPPWGFTEQPPFLNMVIEAETSLAPRALLDYLKMQEKALGRVKSFRNGPRQIDLDILFYADLLLENEDLIIPHPRLHQRAFVLVPLAEIAPQFEHPRLKKSITELLQEVDIRGISSFSV